MTAKEYTDFVSNNNTKIENFTAVHSNICVLLVIATGKRDNYDEIRLIPNKIIFSSKLFKKVYSSL